MGQPKLSIIDNEGHNHLLDGLKSLCDVATSLDLEVAFVTAAGVDKLMPSFRKVAGRRGVRILTGLYQSITEPAALRSLLKVQRQTKGRLMVKLAHERDFHRKLYLARTSDTVHVIIGSSNMTMGGLISGGEINIRVALPAVSVPATRLTKIFRGDWRKGFALTAERIRRYEKKSTRPKQRLLSSTALNQILGGATGHTAGILDENGTNQTRRYWCDGIDGYISEKVSTLIDAQTGWERKGYAWSGLRTTLYEDEDYIMLVDRTSKPGRICLVRVRSQTEFPTKDDGRYFVAYTPIKGMKTRKLTRGLLEKLSEIGIVKPGRKRLQMNETRWNKIVALFRK